MKTLQLQSSRSAATHFLRAACPVLSAVDADTDLNRSIVKRTPVDHRANGIVSGGWL
jgi:hypothetical protein